MKNLLEVNNVVKKYGDFTALNDVSLHIPKGCVFGLLGPNGAGKTSLIRIINQITMPDSGTIILDGEKLAPNHIEYIGYLPEERGLYKSMKVGEQALYLAQLLDQAGCPSGVYQNLLMDNQQCAEVIANPIVKAVSLTGSELAGRSIAQTAGQSLKKCVLELGGSDAFIVLKDADIQQAAKTAALSRFSNAGQTCIAAKRFIVLEEVVDAFIAALKQEAQSFSCDSNDPEKSGMAVMAKASLKEKLQQQVNDSIHQGAEIIYRAEASEHPHSFPATILDHVASGMPAYDEELFGPVASIIRVKSIEQAITVANDTSFGLAASIWSQNTEQASILANQLDCGSVFINSLVKSDIRLPFGGCKQSGFGRELSALGIREFCNIKTVVFA